MSWIQYPRVEIDTVYGTVQAAFTDAGHVSISTDAHVNDDEPAIRYRNRDYLIHMHLYAETGWRTNADPRADYTSIKRRDNWADAAPTYARAILDEVQRAVAEYVTASPYTLQAAEYADANNKASDLTTALEAARVTERDLSRRLDKQLERKAKARSALAEHRGDR